MPCESQLAGPNIDIPQFPGRPHTRPLSAILQHGLLMGELQSIQEIVHCKRPNGSWFTSFGLPNSTQNARRWEWRPLQPCSVYLLCGRAPTQTKRSIVPKLFFTISAEFVSMPAVQGSRSKQCDVAGAEEIHQTDGPKKRKTLGWTSRYTHHWHLTGPFRLHAL